MRLFLDECLSPIIANDLMKDGDHYAVHPRNMGGLGHSDQRVLRRCIAEDLVIVTVNARDFRALAAREEIHPGLIILPCVDRKTSRALLLDAIAWLEARGRPADIMVNRVLEIGEDHAMRIYDLPLS